LEGGDEETPRPVHGVPEVPAVSVYWLELYVSHVPELLPAVPELLASRAQTEIPYVPAGLPVVVQLKVAPAE
jgi:hypothetical protein